MGKNEIRIIIEDIVAKMDGKPETILPDNTVIRFEIGNTKLTCIATQEGLEIRKINDFGLEKSAICITSISSNMLYVH